MPMLRDLHNTDYWNALSLTIQNAIQNRRSRLILEVDNDQRQQLRLTLQRIRNDFGLRRRKFRKALMCDEASMSS